jgi:nitroreductase
MNETESMRRVRAIVSRRSIVALDAEEPTAEELEAMLTAATTVPDHGTLRPWRLVVIRGEARAVFGDALAEAAREADAQLRPDAADRLRLKAFAAPMLIAIVARVEPEAKVAVWEQAASAACSGYAITLAAHHLGLSAIWKSTSFRNGAALRQVLDMREQDQFLGWVNVGRETSPRTARPRPPVDLTPIVRVLAADGEPLPIATGSGQFGASS